MSVDTKIIYWRQIAHAPPINVDFGGIATRGPSKQISPIAAIASVIIFKKAQRITAYDDGGNGNIEWWRGRGLYGCHHFRVHEKQPKPTLDFIIQEFIIFIKWYQ